MAPRADRLAFWLFCLIWVVVIAVSLLGEFIKAWIWAKAWGR